MTPQSIAVTQEMRLHPTAKVIEWASCANKATQDTARLRRTVMETQVKKKLLKKIKRSPSFIARASFYYRTSYADFHVPDRTRTCDLRIRNPLLYPAELRARNLIELKNGRGGQIRTDDPSLPKRVRYQLRHAPTLSMKTYEYLSALFYGVSDGARTRDPQNHNLMLYQLSYAHHIQASTSR